MERLAPSSAPPRPPRISVIVPVLDEAGRIGGQLRSLARFPALHELIVVDGGSRDETVARVRAAGGARLLGAPRGRASQMNAGARAATGDVLLFLHADVRLPDDAPARIEDALADPEVVAGAFRTWTVPDAGRSWLAPLLHLADLRSRYARLPYGDQALFVRAGAFRRAGGFPEQPLMEDLELARRLARLGRLRVVRSRVAVSGRRFLARPIYYTLAVNVFPALYALGVAPATLKRLYGDPR
jgi:rSAM/selenodomain-associated transferase 2